jgi:hypothetical protein
MKFTSFRSRFRAFQQMRGADPDRGFIADLEFLENRDLDLSIRIGGMMAFNALLVTIGTHPISASPGAPLSLDAPTQPVLVVASIIGIIPFVASAVMCLRALLLGEEFESDGLSGEQNLRQRLYAAFIRSIDVQSKLLRQSVIACFIGGVMTLAVWVWILAEKMV